MIGIGRSSYQKTVDGFVKYKLLRQCEQGCGMPLTAALVAASSITTLPAERGALVRHDAHGLFHRTACPTPSR